MTEFGDGNRRRRAGPAAGLFVMCAAAISLWGCGSDKDAAPGTQGASRGPKEITTKGGFVMVLVPAGEFTMGDDAGAPDERPAHRVGVDPFYIDTTEVTQESYRALTGRNPSKRKVPGGPVEQVSWYDAIVYCNRRSAKEGLKACYDEKTGACEFAAPGYRLPTEAEWEYACRAGTTTRYSFGDRAGLLDEHGWWRGNAGGTLHAVAQKRANPWGLHDMHGGVWEWCNDFYADRYPAELQRNPRGPGSGEKRVLRGGSWRSGPESCGSAARMNETPGFSDTCFNGDLYGFRCVRTAEPGTN